MKRTELLVPVGNKDTLMAAINNGADAVYFAGKKFGARAYSENFTEDEVINAIKTCHLYGVKVYITLNTMIFNDEMDDLFQFVDLIYRNNVDAVIVQDIGVIELLRKYYPDLDVHVSTQAHNHNDSGISYFKSIGCKRVVFDRESSLEQINNIKVDIEKEVFVYGALCVSYSGNCLFSALNGGRSANRGMCVGSCRLSYKLYKNDKICNNGYLLSTKDLNVLPRINEILKSDIDSLKIEGRMKSKEYVAVVTRYFRKAIDAYYEGKEFKLSELDKEKMLKTYNRDFTEGYLFNEDNIINGKSSNHQGVKIGTVVGVNNKKIKIKLDKDLHQEDAIRFGLINKGMHVNMLYDEKGLFINEAKKGQICMIDNKDRIMYDKLIGSPVLKTIDFLLNKEINNIPIKKIPITMEVKSLINEPLRLIVADGINCFECAGNVVQTALKQPITEQNITEQLSKLGGTPFVLNGINILLDDNAFVNIRDLNEIRRQAIEKLISIREGQEKVLSNDYKVVFSKNNNSSVECAILVRTEEQLKIALKYNFKYIDVDSEELYFKYKSYDNIYLKLPRVNVSYKDFKNERLLCTELGSVVKYSKDNFVRTDYYLNIANDVAINTLKKMNVSSVTLSLELDNERMKNIADKKNSEVVIYGRPECMIIKNNIFNINHEKTYLVNDKQQKFPVLYKDGFTFVYLDKLINELDNIKNYRGWGVLKIELFDENIVQMVEIINILRKYNML